MANSTDRLGGDGTEAVTPPEPIVTPTSARSLKRRLDLMTRAGLKRTRIPADPAKQIDKILLDEERHANYSLTFAKKNNSKFYYFIKFFKENLISKLRHLYANSLTKVSKIFNPILYLLILIMYLPVKFLDLDKSKEDNDVLKNINPKSIL